MPTELTDMELLEISLVDKGANPGAKVLLMKRDEETNPYEDLVAEVGQAAADELIKGLFEEDDMSDEVEKMSDEEERYMKTLSMEDMARFKGMSPEDRKKMMGVKKADTNEEAPVDTITKADLDSYIQKAIEPYQAQIDSLKSEIAKREEAEAIRKLQDELVAGHVQDAENVAKRLIKLPVEDRDELKKSFLAAGEALAKSGIFKEAGSEGDRSGSTAIDELNDLAKAYASEKNVPFTTAFNKVYTDPKNRDLVNKYKSERKGA